MFVSGRQYILYPPHEIVLSYGNGSYGMVWFLAMVTPMVTVSLKIRRQHCSFCIIVHCYFFLF